MAPPKETLMVLKVDLDCHRCYTKVKRLLCCYPQIMDQIYNEKQNTVRIKVVCCTPEKIRDKLLSRGGKSIKGIQILDLEPKKPAEKPMEAPVAAEKPKQAPPAEKPKQAPPAEKPPKEAAPANKPKEAAPKPAAPAEEKPPEKIKKNGSKNGASKADLQPAGKPQGDAPAAKPQGDAPAAKPKDAEAPPKPAAQPKPAEQAAAMMHMMPPELIQYYPGYPVNAGCMECYDGRMCYHGNGFGYGAPPPPPPPAGGWGYYGAPAPGGYGYGYKPVNRYDDYVSDENPAGCVVM